MRSSHRNVASVSSSGVETELRGGDHPSTNYQCGDTVVTARSQVLDMAQSLMEAGDERGYRLTKLLQRNSIFSSSRVTMKVLPRRGIMALHVIREGRVTFTARFQLFSVQNTNLMDADGEKLQALGRHERFRLRVA